MNTGTTALSAETETKICPSCRGKTRAVPAVTIHSLVKENALSQIGDHEGFHFCSRPFCNVVYCKADGEDRVYRENMKVRVGQKEETSPRPVCYCFDHTVEEIEADVAAMGTSTIPDEITQKCREGQDRCRETNPQGSCCLGNVRQALKDAQTKHSATISGNQNATVTMATATQIGALVSAIIASACCWLPLLLIALGVSGGALASIFETWRPVLLPTTFVLLGLAFYFTYRRPRVVTPSTDPNDCCIVGSAEDSPATCCPGSGTEASSLNKFNKVVLWVVTVLVLAFAMFPNYVGYIIEGGRDTKIEVDRSDGESGGQSRWSLSIDGMTCQGCAAGLQKKLKELPGVAKTVVHYPDRTAQIWSNADVTEDQIRKAVSEAGYTVRSMSK